MIEQITFNWENGLLTLTLDDETTKEYAQADKDQYLADYPDRAADVAAMGW